MDVSVRSAAGGVRAPALLLALALAPLLSLGCVVRTGLDPAAPGADAGAGVDKAGSPDRTPGDTRPPDRAIDHAATDLAVDHAATDLAVDRATTDLVADLAAADLAADRAATDLVVDLAADTRDGNGADEAGGCGPLTDIHNCGSCGHDCTALPNIAGYVQCFSGQCYSSCQAGFAACWPNYTDVGCPVDLSSDPKNCGQCGTVCGLVPGSPGICRDGTCVGECPDGYGDCTPVFGCETWLGSATDCGACGVPACDLANVNATCNPNGPHCQDAVCQPEFAHCDPAGNGCEAAYETPAAACMPTYAGTVAFPFEPSPFAFAVAADGSYYVGGYFEGTADFDPTDGIDLHAAGSVSTGFITKINADGSYGWTQTFTNTGYSSVTALAATADGGVIAAGNYSGIVDLDPSPASAYHTTTSQGEPFVVALTGAGALAWGRTFVSLDDTTNTTATQLAVDAGGGVHVAGQLSGGRTDFDPGPGSAVDGADLATAFLVGLNAGGDFVNMSVYDLSLSPSCYISVNALTAGGGGGAWLTGTYSGACDFDPGEAIDLQVAGSFTSSGFVTRQNADGSYGGTASFDATVNVTAMTITTDGQGAVYVAGDFSGDANFDRAANDGLLTSSVGTGFVVKLDGSGTFQWVRPLDGLFARAIGIQNGGGNGASTVIVAGTADGGAGMVAAFDGGPGRGPRWTHSFGGYSTFPAALAVRPTDVLVAGTNDYAVDFDPGAATDDVDGSTLFVTRYKF
jgi:hypothetical protein